MSDSNDLTSASTDGIILILIALGVYFLLPINIVLGVTENLGISENLGIPRNFLSGQPNFTLSSLFSICSSGIGTLASLLGKPEVCQTINFVSYIIFVIAFIGILLLIKGILYTK